MPDGSHEAAADRGASPAWRRRFGLTRAYWLRLALGFAVGGIGALVFLTLELPLPWFLGALTFCLAASVLNAPLERPRVMSIPVRAVLGVAIGAAFTPALLAMLGGMAGSLLLVVPFMLVLMFAGMAFFERVARFDRPTAFFCAVPGGLTDMVTMASDAGANERAVTLIQATRILMIVALLPFWLQINGQQGIGGAIPPGVHLSDFRLVDAAVLVALGWAGWLLAKRIGLAGAPLVGPMVLSGLAHAGGFTSAKVPVEVMIFAQITLGIMLGAQFRGVTWKEFSSTMVWGIAFALLLVALTAAVAVGVSRLTGFGSTSVLLAFAPGGQTELNLLAYILGLDVAYTALHHLVRLAIVILGAQLVFAANRDWRSRRG
ncbi:MAG: AbrB family transcriptional regulator [Hyphomicrobiaceae bacterium]|nr:AbrB family transcriptional regulator [Hyphomicrobiaceae bacterium]